MPPDGTLTGMPTGGDLIEVPIDGTLIEVPIDGTLDLHAFRPAEVADVVREYLDAADARGLRDLRFIHGKGTGVQRRTVRTLLGRDPRVVDFGDAPEEAGGWGATWVRLRGGQ